MKKFFSVCLMMIPGLAFQAHAAQTSTEPETIQNQVVGSLPYSNQWVYDQRQSMLYLSFNHGTMASPIFKAGQYESDYHNSDFNYGSIDYFLGMFSVGSAESSSAFLRNLQFWTRYGVGAGVRRASLRNNEFVLNASAENAFMTSALLRVGPQVTYILLSWLQPYVGIEISPFIFRQSSSMSGAETQGAGALFGPVAGLHLPAFFSGRASLYGEVRRNIVLSDEHTVFGSSTTFGGGLGMVF